MLHAHRVPLLALLLASPALTQNLIALTADNRLVPLRAGATLTIGPATPITGLAAGESILGIDFRPANGALYALGSSSRLYTIDPGSGNATAAGAPLTTALSGSEFGFDFNPTVDRIRIVSDTGQSLRVNPDTGAAIVDGTLAFATADPNASATPAVAASGYTNSFAGATATTLFGIDAGLDVLVSQLPPNSGTLNTIGSLGRDVTTVAGFDIAPAGGAWALLNTAGSTNGTTQLFTIDLMTGGTTWAGTIANASPSSRLRGLAVMPPRPDVELVALTDDRRLLRFDVSAPWAAPAIAAVTGLAAGEDVLAIDFRPATGQLFALGSLSQMYTINPLSGVATAIGSPLVPPLAGTQFGFDFNPTVDRIRIASNLGQNLRVNPDTGATTVDGPLAYAANDPGFGTVPGVVGSAYTNDLPGATSTLLFAIEATRDVLATQNPPNAGTLNTVGALGRDVSGVAGFDIGSDGRAHAVLQDGSGSHLYRVDLANGSLTWLANLGLAAGAPLRGLAVRPAAGLAAFGMATAGCAGPAWLGARGTPFAGSTQFTLVSHRGPPNALGFFVLAASRLQSPNDYGGVMAWLDPMTFVFMGMATNDTSGTGELVVPLLGAYFGLDLYWQWVGFDPCGRLGLATTAGLQVTVQ